MIFLIFRLSRVQGSGRGPFLPRFKGYTGVYSPLENWKAEQKIEAEKVLTLTRPLVQGLTSMEGQSFQYVEAQGLLNPEPKTTSNPTPPTTGKTKVPNASVLSYHRQNQPEWDSPDPSMMVFLPHRSGSGGEQYLPWLIKSIGSSHFQKSLTLEWGTLWKKTPKN